MNRSLTTSATPTTTAPLHGLVAGLLICFLAMGCAGISQGEDKYTIKNVMGKMAGQTRPRNADGSLMPLEGQEEFDKLHELVESQDPAKYAEAEAGFKALAKKYKDKPIEEDAMFYVAECQFLQKHYPAAQDSIDELLNKYTGSRHIEKSTRRLFAIANTWLNSPKPASEVELAAYKKGELKKDQPSTQQQETTSSRLTPNFTDPTRPFFDTSGRALQALKSIWLKDPTGPLADDALMMTATHFLRQKDYREADHYYSTLRESYPKSEHIELAYVLGSHAKMMTYQGPQYDGRLLEDARKLTQATLKLFPKSPQRKQLEQDLAEMKAMLAARDWAAAELYVRKGYPQSAVLYCRTLMQEYPGTVYSDNARKMLAEIDPKGSKVIQASGTMPIQREPKPVTAMNDTDPSCAAPRNGKGSSSGSTAGRAGKVRLGGTRQASRDSDEFSPGRVGQSGSGVVPLSEELPELEEVPPPPSKKTSSRTLAPRKEPRRMPVDEQELDDLPEGPIPSKREKRPLPAVSRKLKPVEEE